MNWHKTIARAYVYANLTGFVTVSFLFKQSVPIKTLVYTLIGNSIHFTKLVAVHVAYTEGEISEAVLKL